MANIKMIPTKVLTQKAMLLRALSIGACLSSLVVPLSFIPDSVNAQSRYGLGLSAGSGGATRSSREVLTLIVPEDGIKTVSLRPAVYFYLDASLLPKSTFRDGKESFLVKILLRDGTKSNAKTLFSVEGKAEKSGLYKFSLPENVDGLVTGQVYRLQVRWNVNNGNTNPEYKAVNAIIRRDGDSLILKEISSAKTDLEKARIYKKGAYWYEALDAYNSWISKNSNDTDNIDLVRGERRDLLKYGLLDNKVFKSDLCDLQVILNKFDQSERFLSIEIPPKDLTSTIDVK